MRLPAIKGAEKSWFFSLISFCHASLVINIVWSSYLLQKVEVDHNPEATEESFDEPSADPSGWLWCYTWPSSSLGLQSIRKAEIYGASTVYYLTNPRLLPCGLVYIKFINAQKWEPPVSVHSCTCLSFLCCITLVTYSVSAPPVMATTHCIWIQPSLEICPSVKLKSAL